MLSLAAGPEKAPPDTTQADMLATEAVHDALLDVLEIEAKLHALYDERDRIKGWVRGELTRRDRKSLTFSDCSVRLAPAQEAWCTCHSVPIRDCANASQGIPVVVKAVDCTPYLVVRARP